MFPNIITRYIKAISRTRKGLRILIVDGVSAERELFREIAQHYLPESTATALNSHELTEELDRYQPAYDLVILEAGLILESADRPYIQQLRTKFPDAKIALFTDPRDLYKLQAIPQLSSIDILLTKCATAEALAEKLCLTFQDPDKGK